MISPAEITYLRLRNLSFIYLYVKPYPQQLKVAALILGNSSPATRAAHVPLSLSWGSSQPKQHRGEGAQEKSLGCFFFFSRPEPRNQLSVVLKEDARYLDEIKHAHGWFSETLQPSPRELSLGRAEARCREPPGFGTRWPSPGMEVPGHQRATLTGTRCQTPAAARGGEIGFFWAIQAP